MKLKTILFGILILLTIFVLIDFYRQNESRKIDKTFKYLKANKSEIDTLKDFKNLKSVIKETSEFKADFLSQMTSKVSVAKHLNFIDYLKPKKIIKEKIFNALNDTTNFSIGETTFDKVDYVLRFYDFDNQIIMKIWIGLDCKMLDSEPKITKIKSGHLSEKGLTELKKILEE